MESNNDEEMISKLESMFMKNDEKDDKHNEKKSNNDNPPPPPVMEEEDNLSKRKNSTSTANTTVLECHVCQKSLAGKRYLLKDDLPCCTACFEEKYANVCDQCRKPIGSESKDLCHMDRHWHGDCFQCNDCQKSLIENPFATKDDQLFCPTCYEDRFALRCDGCQKVFRGGSKKYEYNDKRYHEECFQCLECSENIGAGSFIPRDNHVICVRCFEEKHTQKCKACHKAIVKGGISYKGTGYHKECFKCTRCPNLLAGTKFTSKEERPYCADCYAELFCKKCSQCQKAISGLDGLKYVTYEDQQWHNDCFVCYKCNTSLVGKGFLPADGLIYCGDCGQDL